MLRVIFHIDNKDNFSKLFNNINNILNEFIKNDNKYHIIVLANGDAVLGYLDSINIIKINNFPNVSFKACNNSLNSLNINKSLLTNNILVIDTGVYELTVKQNNGYSYIKV